MSAELIDGLDPIYGEPATPVRLRLSRARGFDLQAYSQAVNGLDAVNVARPSIYGNPFIVGKDGDRAACVDWFTAMLAGYDVVMDDDRMEMNAIRRAAIRGNLERLRGKNLACWCRLDGKPCHADVLLKAANRPVCVAAKLNFNGELR